MDFHIVTIILILLIGWIFSTLKSCDTLVIRKTYLIIVTIILILESGLRGMSVGDDTINYYDIFESIKFTSWTDIMKGFNFFSERSYEERDPGYDLFQKIFQLFFNSYRVFLVFVAVVFFSSLYYFLLRNTKTLIEIIFAFLIYSTLFYYFFSITGIRQSITTAVALYCSKFIFKRNFLKFCIPILLASLIHSSVLIFLPFYFNFKFKNIKINFLIALVLFAIIFIFKQNLVLFLLRDSIYQTYLEDLNGAGTFVFTTLLLLVVLLSYFLIESMKLKYLEYITYYNAILLALILVPLTFVNSNAMRVVQYYSIYLIVFAPKIISLLFNKNLFVKNFAYFLCFMSLFLSSLRSQGNYKFYWEEQGIYSEK